MPDVKYTADFSQIRKEVDELMEKVQKLDQSLEKTSKKFGDKSPQATMVHNALTRVSAQLDKKLGELEKLNFGKAGTSILPGAVGGDPATIRDLEIRYRRESLKYYNSFKDYTKNFKTYSSEITNLTRGMMGMGANIIKLATGGALGAAGGIFGGAMPLAKSFVEDRRQALYLGGANIGKMKAAGTSFGNIMNVPDALSKISAGQFDVQDPAYIALKLLGFSDEEIQGSDPSDLLAKALTREQKRVKGYKDTQTAITMEEKAYKATALFSPEVIKGLRALPSGELEQKEQDYNDRQKTLDLTLKEQQAIDQLVSHMNNAGQQIETVMVKNLAKMEPYLVKFSDFFTDFVVNRIRHDEGGTAKDVGKNILGGAADIYKWIFGGKDDKHINAQSIDTPSFFDYMEKGFETGWEKLFGQPEDKWRPFFQDLEKDWKNFFNKLSENLPSTDATAMSLAVPGGGSFREPSAPPSLSRRGTHGGRWPNTGMTGAPASSAEVQAIMNEAKTSGKFPDTIAGHTAFIRMMAPKYGIDPQFAVDVAASEGLYSKRKSQGSYVDVDAHGNPYSFWDYQLNYRRGVGTFAAKEGIDPRRPEDWMKADEFALRWIKSHGMEDWRTDRAYQRYGGRVRHVPEEKVTIPTPTTSPTSLNDMRNFQTSSKLAMTIHNAAGANYVVHGAMLGSGAGNYGTYVG